MNVEKVTPKSLESEKAAEYALAVCEEGLGKSGVKTKNLGGGSFGTAVGVTFGDGSEAVVKFLRADGMLEKETHDLQLLSENCGVRMPKVLYFRSADGSIPLDCYVMDKIEGSTLFMSFGKLLYSKSAKLAFADKVTDALHGIHECRCDKFGDTMNPQFSSWLECYEPFMEDVYLAAKQLSEDGQLSPEIVSAMSRARDKFQNIFSQPVYDACLIHGDLNVMNVMSDKRLNITAIIDPLECKWADKEFDLFQLRNLTGECFGLYEAYKRKYPVSEKCDLKCAFYAVYHEVYCLISTGTNTEIILAAAVKRLKRELKKAGITS